MGKSYKNRYIEIAGIISFIFAVFQLSAVFWPKQLLAFFGGPVKTQSESPVIYILSCVLVSTLFAIFGFYALSGARIIHRLPLLKLVLIATTGIYILRGLAVIPNILKIYNHPDSNFWRFSIFSAIVLLVGCIHLVRLIKFIKTDNSSNCD